MTTLAERIARFGSVRFDEYVELVLYDPDVGFFSNLGAEGRGRAGRSGGDFITSPEVGPLFGAVVARWLDARWEELGRPDPYVVIEAGAGRGALALSVLTASPTCATALRYVLVERSAGLRRAQAEHLALSHPFDVLGPSGDLDEGVPSPVAGTGPLFCSLPDLPAEAVNGVVIANELLDNLPFRLFQRSEPAGSAPTPPVLSPPAPSPPVLAVVLPAGAGRTTARTGQGQGQGQGPGSERWEEVRVAVDAGRLVELLVPADDDVAVRLDALAPDARPGARVPLQSHAAAWLRSSLEVLRSGSVIVVDYARSRTAEFAEQPMDDWLRTYRDHDRGSGPLEDPGAQDITVDVAVDQLATVAAPTVVLSQADWLRRYGIGGLVEEGRRIWTERAGIGDLTALRARSRAVEADALVDPTGLGAFRVVEWRQPPDPLTP